jgi:hypothetical protein
MAYFTGGPVLQAQAERPNTDYSRLLGFVAPAVRIDPHSHEAKITPQPDLRRISEIIQQKPTGQSDKPAK